MSAFHLRKRNLTRYLPQSNRILNLGTAFTFLTAFQSYMQVPLIHRQQHFPCR